jgi:hypothetical protein
MDDGQHVDEQQAVSLVQDTEVQICRKQSPSQIGLENLFRCILKTVAFLRLLPSDIIPPPPTSLLIFHRKVFQNAFGL